MQRFTRARTLSLILGFVSFVMADAAAHAATTYTWETTTTNSSWSVPGDWSPTGPADGAGNTADFSELNITGDTTVNLDSNRTIGTLLIGDTAPSNNWILASTGGTLTLDNTGGTGQPTINIKNGTDTISTPLAGTNGVLITGGLAGTSATLNLSGANTYSGVTTINALTTGATSVFNIDAQTSSAFGTSSINYNPGTSNEARILLDSGVTLANNFTLTSVRPAQGQGAIQTNPTQNIGGGAGAITATITGTITKTGASNQGADFAGPNIAGDATDFLILSGPIIDNLPSQTKGNSQTGIQIRLGNVRMADTTGTSSVPSVINPRDGILQVGATNGIATNAFVDIGGNVGNPGGIGRAALDLNGFNQTLVGVSNYVSMVAGNTQAANEFITNSSNTSATLTLRPIDTTLGGGRDPNQANLVYTAYPSGIDPGTAFITDSATTSGGAGSLNIAVNGDPNGIQYLTTPNGSQHGSVTLTGGILAISSLAIGGSNSSIGASSNAATNLIFNGGTLRYVNTGMNAAGGSVALSNSTTPSTDRSFTINPGKTGTIDIDSASTTLTWSGGSANTTGVLNKAGLGTLILTGANQHTGGTNVNVGTLLVNGTGNLSTGTVNILSGATLGGNGTIGGTVVPAIGGTLVPGNPSVSTGVGTLTLGALTLNNGSNTNFNFGTGNSEITVSNAGGLTVNGGNLNLFAAGTSNPFATAGTYTLFNYNGGFSGSLNNFSIADPVAGKQYNFGGTGSAVQLTIVNVPPIRWNGGSGNWEVNTNWEGNTVPNAQDVGAEFGQLGSNGTVTLGANNETVGYLLFDAGGFTINNNTSSTSSGFSLTLDSAHAAGAINVNAGSNKVALPIICNVTSAVSVASGTALTISGNISGGKPLNVSGSGTLTLTGSNTYSTMALSNATLNVGTFGGADTTGTLGSGTLTMASGATLNFNRVDAGGYTFGGGIIGSGVGAGAVFQLGSGGKTTISGAISNLTTLNVAAGTLVTSSTVSQTGGLYVTGLTSGASDPTVQGSGSLTAAGAISGAGALFVNTTGTVNLNAANSYSPGNLTTAGTTINGGTVNLGAAGALPANTSLAVNGGTLNLNGKNITLSNVLDATTSTGVITNNLASSTSTITFTGTVGQNYNFYAALNDAPGGGTAGKVAVVTGISNTASGPPIFTVNFNATSTFSGGLTVNSQSIQANATNAFGTGPITIALNNSSTSSSQIFLAPGVTIPNNITIAQGHPVPNNGVAGGLSAVISEAVVGGPADAVVNGTVTIQANNLNGGLFQGPAVGGLNFLDINGAVNTTGTANTIVQSGGNVKYSGGGSYPNLLINGLAALGATNGLAQNALLQFSIEPSASPAVAAVAGTLDLNGFNQTAVALSAASATLTSTVQNSGTGPNTLTLNTSGTNSFNGSINDGTSGGTTNLFVQGTGTQALTGSSSYTGITTFSGTSIVQAADLENGLTASSIGAASADPSRLVFDGGTLQYTGASSTSTDHGFTINAGKTAHIGVNTSGVNLTLTGTSPASTGSFEKTGPGNLTFDGAASIGYTGSTTVSGGRLFVNNQLTGTSSVSVAAGATLAGSGTIGSPTSTFSHTAGTINPGVVGGSSARTLTIGGNLTLAGGGVTYDVDDTNLSNQALQDLVKINGVFDVTAATPIELDFLNPGASPTAFNYKLFQFGSTSTTLSTLQSDLVFSTNLTAGRLTATPTFNGNTVVISVTVAPAAVLSWNSTSSGAWDTSTANWFNSGTSAVDKFVNGDQVTFADTTHGGSTPQNAITIAGTVSPSVFNITSNSVNYTFSGAGKISGGGALNISGSSTTTIKTNNDYSGGTNITNASATVDVGGSGTSGLLGTGDVQNNGTLKFTRTDGNALNPVTFVNNINGTGNLTNSCPGTTVMSGNINQNSVTLNGSGTTTLQGSVSTSSTTAGITVSGNTSATFQGSLNTSVVNGAGLSVSGTSSAFVGNGLNGSGGITVNTTAFVTVAGSSGYSGNTVINAGTFFTNAASALGDTTGTTTVNSPGSLFVVQGNADYGAEVLTINGTGTANNGALHAGGTTTSTFENTVSLGSDSLINIDNGSTLALTAVTNGTALNGNNHQLSLAGTGTISIGGNVTNVTGIASTGSTIAFAPAASTTLTISTPISGTGTIVFNTGGTPAPGSLGTTALTANNSSFTGNLTVGTGIVQITAANQLGSGTGTITFPGDGGTPPPAADGTLLAASGSTISIPNPLSLGARQGLGTNVPLIENVSGNTTFTGAVTMTSGGTDYTFQSDSGSLAIQGNINTQPIGPANFNNRRLDLQGNGNGALNGVLTDAQDTTPGSDATGNPISITKSGSGTWTLGATSAVHGDLTVNDSGKLVIAAGKSVSFTDNPGGHGNLILNIPASGPITGATPHISFGSTGSDTGSSLTVSSATWGAPDTVLKIDNWTYGAGANGDHFVIGANPGASVLTTQIQFADFKPGASISTFATAARSVGEITPKIGDVNQDGLVNAADVSVLMSGLSNISAYQSARALTSPSGVFTASDAKFLLDVNGDGVDTNTDIQAEISLIATIAAGGTGVLHPVPEPASFVLLALGGALFLAERSRRKFVGP